MDGSMRSLVPAEIIPGPEGTPSVRRYLPAQKVPIREIITRGHLDVLPQADTAKVLAIAGRFEDEYGYSHTTLEDHVIAFLEFEYNHGIDDDSDEAWKTYSQNLKLEWNYWMTRDRL